MKKPPLRAVRGGGFADIPVSGLYIISEIFSRCKTRIRYFSIEFILIRNSTE